MQSSLRSLLVIIALLAVPACGGGDDDGGSGPGETGAEQSISVDQDGDDDAVADRSLAVELPTDPIPYASVFTATDAVVSECLLIDPVTFGDAVGADASVVSAAPNACRMQTMPGSTMTIVVGDEAPGLLASPYTLDAVTIEEPQSGPGSNAVLYLDPPIDGLRDRALPFGYSFLVDAEPVALRMSGLSIDEAGFRKIADTVTENLLTGIDTEPVVPVGPSCGFISVADVAALTGFDESMVVLEDYEPAFGATCVWSLGGQRSLRVGFADNNQFTFTEQLAEPEQVDRREDFDGEFVVSPDDGMGNYYLLGYFEEDSYTGISVSTNPEMVAATDALLANILSRVERPDG